MKGKDKVQINAKVNKQYREWLEAMQQATRVPLVALLEQAIELRYQQWLQAQKVKVA